MGRKVRMRKSDSCEANDSHVGVDVFQKALCEEDQPHRNPNQQNAAWGVCWFEEEPENCVYQWITSIQLSGLVSDGSLAQGAADRLAGSGKRRHADLSPLTGCGKSRRARKELTDR